MPLSLSHESQAGHPCAAVTPFLPHPHRPVLLPAVISPGCCECSCPVGQFLKQLRMCQQTRRAASPSDCLLTAGTVSPFPSSSFLGVPSAATPGSAGAGRALSPPWHCPHSGTVPIPAQGRAGHCPHPAAGAVPVQTRGADGSRSIQTAALVPRPMETPLPAGSAGTAPTPAAPH